VNLYVKKDAPRTAIKWGIHNTYVYGTPGRIRTFDHRIRSPKVSCIKLFIQYFTVSKSHKYASPGWEGSTYYL